MSSSLVGQFKRASPKRQTQRIIFIHAMVERRYMSFFNYNSLYLYGSNLEREREKKKYSLNSVLIYNKYTLRSNFANSQNNYPELHY